MATWSGARKKLEKEYLAESLRGRVQYYATAYRESHDSDKGRAAIRVDGKEIVKGDYFNQYFKEDEFPKDETYEKRMWCPHAVMDDTAVKLGTFDQYCFYAAFKEFDNQSIEESLKSENMLVRIFAVLDRRLGKRRLERMKETIADEEETFRTFYMIRAQAEGLL